jgi:hypothetical protein
MHTFYVEDFTTLMKNISFYGCIQALCVKIFIWLDWIAVGWLKWTGLPKSRLQYFFFRIASPAQKKYCGHVKP